MLIDGHDVRDVTLASLRSQIGIVTQETVLFNDTVRNNIAYGQPHVSPKQVEERPRSAGARIHHGLPDGYDTMIGERGVRLSGGERQRMAIARAILKNAPILILDEATSALWTANSESLVQSALQNLMNGRTVFVIAHRLSTVRTRRPHRGARERNDYGDWRARRADAKIGNIPAALRIAIRDEPKTATAVSKAEHVTEQTLMPIRSMTGFAQVEGRSTRSWHSRCR